MLESYSAALNEAMEEICMLKLGRHEGIFGNWQLGIDTLTGVVYHAMMIS